jgi:hypothetical protein
MDCFGKREGGRRSSARDKAALVAVFTTITRSYHATLVDVSATGARLSGIDLPLAGELVELRIADVRAFGVVRWADDFCGVVFDVPLGAGDVESLRTQIQRAGGLPPELRAAYEDWTVGFAR